MISTIRSNELHADTHNGFQGTTAAAAADAASQTTSKMPQFASATNFIT